MYLSLGSSEGLYDVRVSNLNGEPLVTGAGTAKIRQGITLLPIEINLSTAKPGLCVLQLRRVGTGRNSYALRMDGHEVRALLVKSSRGLSRPASLPLPTSWVPI
jgi:hypothetical protein